MIRKPPTHEDFGLVRVKNRYRKSDILRDLQTVYDCHLTLPAGIQRFEQILYGQKRGLLQCGHPADDFSLPGNAEFMFASLGSRTCYMVLSDSTVYNSLSREIPVLQIVRFFNRQDYAFLRDIDSSHDSPLVRKLFQLVVDFYKDIPKSLQSRLV